MPLAENVKTALSPNPSTKSDATGVRPRSCGKCQTAVAGQPHVHGREGVVCEGCFLAERLEDTISATGEVMFSLAEALAAALDAREHETGLHSKRVACHTLVLARRFTADPEHLRQVYWGALLHDIGKIGTPDVILCKQGPLDENEWKIMRAHPETGARILAGVPQLAEATQIVLSHEERFDGSGYPRGLRGEAIPLWARLFAIIDTLDAMTSDRPYRKGASFDTAHTEIARQSGAQFDPLAVDAFLAEEEPLRAMVNLKCGAAIA